MSLWRGYDSYKFVTYLSVRDGWKCKYCGCDLMSGVTWNAAKQCVDDRNELNYAGYGLSIDDLNRYKQGIKRATVDHVVPISKGGDPKNTQNMVLSCQRCNSKKGAR